MKSKCTSETCQEIAANFLIKGWDFSSCWALADMREHARAIHSIRDGWSANRLRPSLIGPLSTFWAE